MPVKDSPVHSDYQSIAPELGPEERCGESAWPHGHRLPGGGPRYVSMSSICSANVHFDNSRRRPFERLIPR